jgi:hypothetical protein
MLCLCERGDDRTGVSLSCLNRLREHRYARQHDFRLRDLKPRLAQDTLNH